ncbi:MAG: cohesin domain-containing protein [Saprospiraceae bacterium]
MIFFTFFLQTKIKKTFLSLWMVLIMVPLFANDDHSLLSLQCPDDVIVGPLPGECGFYLNFDSLIWSSSEPFLDYTFTPGPGYFFPPETTIVTLSVSDTLGNIETCTFSVTLIPPTQALNCNDNVAINFEGECTQELSPFDILVGGPYGCAERYDAYILSALGANLGNIVDTGFLGKTYTVKVTDTETGQFCWGSIIVQSTGMPQIMTCPADITIFCHENYDSVGLPVIEGCFTPAGYTHTYLDIKENSFCDGDDIAFTVERKWTTADPTGNETYCSQIITAKRVKFIDIDFPPNLDGIELPPLECSDMVDVETDTDVSITGIPLVNGTDPATLACNLTFLMSDSIENTCGNNFIIKRKWQAFDYCTDEFFSHTQIIVIADNKGPEFTAPDTILFSNNNNCTSTILLPRINLINECSDFSIQITTPWYTFNSDSVYATMTSIPGFYNVLYTATDVCDNISKDTIVVQVSGGLLAHCQDDVEISADFYLDNLQVALDTGNTAILEEYFGAPEYFANCVFNPTEEVIIDLNSCLEGAIMRTHTITLNGNPIICNQAINVYHVSDFVVQFPAHRNGEPGHLPGIECGTSTPDFGEPKIFNETCELIAITYEDEVFTDDPGACYKVVRQWFVINWCVAGDELDQEVVEDSELALRLSGCLSIINLECDLDHNGNCDDRTFRDSWATCNLPGADEANQTFGPDTDPDSDPWDGFITYQQIIKVSDSVDPIFPNGCDVPDICITGNDCLAEVILPLPVVEDCFLDVSINASLKIGAIWNNGAGPYPGIAAGTYQVRYVAADNCNNQSACETTVKVKDCESPTPKCKTGVVASLLSPSNANPFVKIFASDLDNNSFDNCPGSLKFSFSADETDVSRDYSCDDLGFNAVELWVSDYSGNQGFCNTNIAIVDQFGDCTGAPLFTGNIETEEEEGINNIDVEISYFGTVQTDINGNFSFPNGAVSFPYYIAPFKDDDILNGVTTFDIVLLTRQILGVALLDSPYKIIAADANGSGSVTTFDAVVLRKLILGIDSSFPNNTSWRFIDKAFTFNNPNNPFTSPFSDTIWVNSPNVMQANFIGIKTGDLNGSAVVNLNSAMNDREYGEYVFLRIKNKSFGENEYFELPVYLNDKNIIGFQTTIKFDHDILELIKIKEGILTEENFGEKRIKNGQLDISYNQLNPINSNESDPLFTLFFKAKKAGNVLSLINIFKDGLLSEAYTNGLKIIGLELNFLDDISNSTKAQFYDPQPNPFFDQTLLPFYLPEAGLVKIVFMTSEGKVLKSMASNFAAGHSHFSVKSDDFQHNGLLLYRIETAHATSTGKLILLN